MGILLRDMGVADAVSIVATDIDPTILEKAQAASYPMKSMEVNEKNYIRFQGGKPLTQYYKEENGRAVFNRELLANVQFRRFDLVTGEPFNKFDLILCRNVMIYFDRDLQARALKLFDESLEPLGFLALGSKETIKFSSLDERFQQLDPKEKIWRKLHDFLREERGWVII